MKFEMVVICGIVSFLVCGGGGEWARGGITPMELRCEYATNPLGIDTAHPRFSWKLASRQRGQMQAAYQILAASSDAELSANKGDLWDSGKVNSDQSNQIPYAGKDLVSGAKYYWKVRVWDQDGKSSDYSQQACWTMGLLHPGDWGGQWIDGENLFRKEFDLNKKVMRAQVFISGLGYYELRINGKKIGDQVLDPGWTEYTRTVLYVTYDVTGWVNEGKNTVGVMLGRGHYRDRRLLLQMSVEFFDGSRMSVVSDGTWKTADGPVRADSVFNGETYDARLERNGWDKPGYDESAWDFAKASAGPGGKLVSQGSEPIKVIKTIDPVDVSNPRPGIYVYDMGQNFAGWARLTVRGDRGTRVVMKFAEDLHKDGMIDPTSNRAAKNTDTYILKGEGIEVYEPRFTYHGFRYVEVTGFPGAGKRENLQGRVVHSAVESVGEFACSNPLINQIHRNILWGLTSNFYSVLTDCPQRDERAGWLECGHLLAEGAMFNFNMAAFYTKWITDMADSQNEEGSLPPQTPYCGWAGWPGDPAWASSYVISPWHLYRHYGDTRILETHYEGMKRWVDFLGTRAENHIVTYNVFGDWATPSTFATPGDLISTAFYYYCTSIMSKSARILGKSSDAAQFSALCKDIKEAFNDEFLYAMPAQPLTASAALTSLPPAGENVVERLIDGNPKTFFWSSSGTKTGDHITIDLGKVRPIERIMISFRGGDYVYKGKLQSSLDAANWSDIADADMPFINEAFSPTPMRYIRILATAEQVPWICMLDFTALEATESEAINRYQYVTGSQCGSALPLFLGIVPDTHKEAVLNDLVHNVLVDHDGHLGIGEVGLKFLIEALTDNGRADVVYTMATKTTYPSWGDIINKGFTTLIEMWDGTGSHNHIMWGTIDEWFYKALAGIDLDPDAPGYKKIIIKPRVIGDLTWAKGSVNTIRGKVASSWEKKGNSLTLNVTIPANSMAKIYVPKIGLKHVKVTESGKIIWNDGSYVGSVAGITAGYENGDYITFDAGSGAYSFKTSETK